jgi:hypothetical protein
MRFKTDDPNKIWEDINQIVLHNYPPSSNQTFSYIARLYREYTVNKWGFKIVEGDPIYLNDMTNEQRTLAVIMGTAQNALLQLLKHQKDLIETEYKNE